MFTVDKKTRYIKSDEGFDVLLGFKSIIYRDNRMEVNIYSEELLDPYVIEIYANTMEITKNYISDLEMNSKEINLIIDRLSKVLDFAGLEYKVTY